MATPALGRSQFEIVEAFEKSETREVLHVGKERTTLGRPKRVSVTMYRHARRSVADRRRSSIAQMNELRELTHDARTAVRYAVASRHEARRTPMPWRPVSVMSFTSAMSPPSPRDPSILEEPSMVEEELTIREDEEMTAYERCTSISILSSAYLREVHQHQHTLISILQWTWLCALQCHE